VGDLANKDSKPVCGRAALAGKLMLNGNASLQDFGCHVLILSLHAISGAKASGLGSSRATLLDRPVARRYDRSVKAADTAVPSATVFENQRYGLVQHIVQLQISSFPKARKWILPTLRTGCVYTDRICNFPYVHPALQDLADALQFFNYSIHGLRVPLPRPGVITKLESDSVLGHGSKRTGSAFNRVIRLHYILVCIRSTIDSDRPFVCSRRARRGAAGEFPFPR
jgi:hypothetical protein